MVDSPDTVGRYQVRSMIGQGGMGKVLLAWDPLLDREVAIKVLKENDDELRERFAREARAVARLRHPNVVMIFDVGEHDSRPFIAMEYVHGETLDSIIRDQKAVPIAQRLKFVEGLCDGLAYAHRSGIIHRDIKPANVIVDAEGGVKILDFGIARASEASRLTRAGMMIGTINYMSPEQVMGKQVDHRSDIFAVGLVLYELLAYRKAFPGKRLAHLINQVVGSAPSPLAELRRGLDPEVIRVVEKAIEKEPEARYQDLRAMRKDLETARLRLERVEDEPTQPMRLPAELLGKLRAPAPPVSGSTSAAQEAERRRLDAERLAEERRREDAERAAAEATRIKGDVEAELARGNAALAAQDFAAAAQAAEAASTLDTRHEGARTFARAVKAAARAEEERQEAERQAEIRRRKEAERVARQQRISAGIAEARAAVDRAEFDAASARLGALEAAEGQAPEIGQATAEVTAARIKGDVEAELARGNAALATQDFAAAGRAAEAALTLDARYEGARTFARAVKDAVRAHERRQKEEQRLVRQKEKQIAVSLKRATKARSDAAAITALEHLLEIDTGHPEARRLLDVRRTALEAEKAEAARRVAQGLPPQPGSGLQALIAKLAAVGPLVRNSLVQGQRSVGPSVAGLKKQIAAWRAPHWGTVGGVVVVLVSAFLWFGRVPAAPAAVSVLPRPSPLAEMPGVPVPLPADPAIATADQPAAAAETPSADRASTSVETPLVPTTNQVALAAAARLEEMLKTAAALYDGGNRPAALEAADAVMAESPAYEPLYEFLRRMQRDGYEETRQSRQAVDAFGERVETLPDYFAGAVAEDLAAKTSLGGSYLEAIRLYWRATEAFHRAVEEARRLPVEPTIDLEPVLAVLREYARALQELDANAVRRVYPSVDMRQLQDQFRAIASQQVMIREPRAVAAAETSVTIRCTIVRLERQRNASVEQQVTRETEFSLVQQDGQWIIAERR